MRKMKKAIIMAVIFCLLVTQMPVYGVKASERISRTTAPAGYTPIRTAEELRDIDGNPGGKYILMNDIDLSQETVKGGDLDGGNGWKPIQGFKGTLDGNSYQIKGLQQFGDAGEANNSSCGLFDDISGATIKNLGLTDCSITAQNCGFYAGVLAASAENSTIQNCYTTGVLKIESAVDWGKVYAGGITGHSKGSHIQNSFSICSITCTNTDRLLDSGSVVGGLIGDAANSASIESSYFAGMITASGIQSGQPLAGYDKDCTVTHSYYLKGSAVVDGKTVTGGIIKAQMNQESSFSGFDFSNAWVIDQDAEYSYPQLIANRYYNLLSMKINSAPKEQTFECRDEFQATGGTMTLTYDRGNTRNVSITEDMITGYDMDTVGSYTLAVSYRGFVDHYDIEVKYVPVKSITLSQTEVKDLEKTDTIKLTAAVLPANATEPDITWQTSDNKIAEVAKDGTVTGVGKGDAVITAYNSDKKVKGECTVHVTIKDHAIRYVLNGGENHADNPSSYTVDDQVDLKAATRKGYDFTGWYTDKTLKNKITEIDVLTRADYVLYAGWKETPYTITYMNQEKEGYKHSNPDTVTVGMGTLQLKDAARKGYTFTGWYTDRELTDKISTVDCTKAENISLYAGWTETPYTVTYAGQASQGYTHDNPYTVTITMGSVPLSDAHRKGYTFKGWFSDETWTKQAFDIDCTQTKDITLYPKWEETSYRIIYANQDEQGYTHDNPNTITIGMGVLKLKEAKRKGYDFAGWYTDAELTQGVDKIDCTKAEDVMLYAGWTETPYTVTYAGQGKQGYTHDNPTTVTITDGKIALKDAQRKGYTFKNWYKDEKLTNPVFEIDCTQAENITLYPGWEENIYNITYAGQTEQKYTHENPDTMKISNGKLVLKDASRKGYDFRGWYIDEKLTDKITYIDCSKAENVTIYAGWVATPYKVTYAGQKEQGYTHDNPDTVTVADGKIALKDARRKGYTFKGWYADEALNQPVKEIDGTQAKEITVYPSWEETSYTVTYMNQTEQEYTHSNPKTVTITQGKILLTDAQRAGYEFAGWYTDALLSSSIKEIDCSRAENITLYPAWKPIKYTITYVVDAGENNADNPDSYTVADTNIVLKDAVFHDYKFLGWYADAEHKEKVTSVDTAAMKDITLYALWEEPEYQINFVDELGDHEAKSYRESQKKVVLEDLQRAGAAFEGWYTDDQYTERITEIDCSQCKNVTVYAKWTLTKYKIEYKLEKGINDPQNPAEYTVKDKEITLKPAVRGGYIFDGWYLDMNYIHRIEKINTEAAMDFVLYPKWSRDETGVTYRIENGTMSLNFKPAGVDYEMIVLPSKGKLKFDKHDSSYCLFSLLTEAQMDTLMQGDSEAIAEMDIKEYRNVSDLSKEYPAGKYYLYMRASVQNWNSVTNKDEEISYTFSPTCTIYYSLDGRQEAFDSYYLQENSEEMQLKLPEIKGYQVEGLYFDAEYKEKACIDKWLGKDWVVYPKVTPVTYNVSYKVNGGENAKENIAGYTIRDKAFELQAPVRSDFDFQGWYMDAAFQNKVESINPAECRDLVLYAKWSAKEYTITYDLAGAADKPDNPEKYTINDEDFTLADPSKKGYTFDGWYDSDGNKIVEIATAERKNYTLTAKWRANTYSITYQMEEGGENSADNPAGYTVEDEDIVLKAPFRKGYTFDGWYLASGSRVNTVKVSDCISLVLTAKWTVERYTIQYEYEGADVILKNPVSYTVLDKSLPLQAPTKSGYDFDGWYTSDGTKLTAIDPALCSNLVLTAKWVQKDDTSKDDAKKDDTSKDDGQKDNTKQDDTQKDDTQKDNTQKDDTQKDDTQKDDTQKDDAKKDDTESKDTTSAADKNTTTASGNSAGETGEEIDDDEEETVTSPATYVTGKTVKKKGMTLYMKEKEVDGYQVRYALKKNMSSAKVRNSSKTKVVLNNLKRKKMYYVQVRTWKKGNGQKKYSAWSRTYKIKTK